MLLQAHVKVKAQGEFYKYDFRAGCLEIPSVLGGGKSKIPDGLGRG